MHSFLIDLCNYGLGSDGNWYHFHSATKSFDEARQICAAEYLGGGRVMAVKSRETHAFLEAAIPSRFGQPLWLGATDQQQEGDFKWIDGNGTLENLTMSNWKQ